MAELARDHGLSALGAEAVAAAETLQARLVVWDGNHGRNIHAACKNVGVAYETVPREPLQ